MARKLKGQPQEETKAQRKARMEEYKRINQKARSFGLPVIGALIVLIFGVLLVAPYMRPEPVAPTPQFNMDINQKYSKDMLANIGLDEEMVKGFGLEPDENGLYDLSPLFAGAAGGAGLNTLQEEPAKPFPIDKQAEEQKAKDDLNEAIEDVLGAME
eukprot:Clim_evm24s99 gene=Clim_evmTU24s99